MAIPESDIIILASHLVAELALAKAALDAAQTAYTQAQIDLSSATARLTALNNIKNSLLIFPDIQQILKGLGFNL